MLSSKEIEYIKAVFKYKTISNKLPLVNNIMLDRNLIEIYYRQPEVTSNTSVYDYMLWLRQLRAELYPNCIYKVIRRKTPKVEHKYQNLTIYQLYHNYK
jgi:hypothetical protein